MVDIGLLKTFDELLPMSDPARLTSTPGGAPFFLGLEFNQIYNI